MSTPSIMNSVNTYETNKMKQNFNAARQGPSSCIIPNVGFNQNILNATNNTIPYNNQINTNSNNIFINSLSGKEYSMAILLSEKYLTKSMNFF